MNITMIAATGGIGSKAMEQARLAGHHLTAVVRDPAKLPAGAVRIVTMDLGSPDIEALCAATSGAEAVLSGLGPRTRADAGIVSRGTRALVEAMQRSGTRRLIAVSAAPVGTVASPRRPDPPVHDPGDGVVMRHLMSPMVKALFRRAYADLALMEDEVRGSGLDWTLVRPPRLTNRPLTGRYRTAYGRNLRRGLTVGRADVAHLMLSLIDDAASVGQTVGVAY